MILARHPLPGIYLEDLCFNAQQASEKALKALLIYHNAPFPHTHDIGRLLTLIGEQGLSVPEEVHDASILTDYAVETRYPGVIEPVTTEEHERAAAIAERVVEWVETMLDDESPAGEGST